MTLYHSWTEMGQGVHTVLRQIACEELGLPPERIRVVVDTERELETGPDDRLALDRARRQRRDRRRAEAEAALAGRPLEELAGQEFGASSSSTGRPPNDADEPVTHLAYGWATQVAILDDEGRLAKVSPPTTSARRSTRLLVEGQIEGGVHMGLGQALSEEFVVEGGVPVTETLKSLHIIPPTGMPEIECILVEEPQPEGPYGAKGIGEAALVPTAAAVAGALYAFDGVRRTRLPMKDSPAALAAVPHLVRRREGDG